MAGPWWPEFFGPVPPPVRRAEETVRKQGAQGAANLAGMTPEEQMQHVISRFPALESALASFTQGGTTPYQTALAEFTRPVMTTQQLGMSPELLKIGVAQNYDESETGKLRYANGVIVDLAQGQVIPGPWVTDPEVEGSEAWLQKVQEWKPTQVKSWRKKLSKLGYEVEEQGGIAEDLLNGLRSYHYKKYLNYGKEMALVPTKAQVREEITKRVDFVSLKESIKGWGEVPFGEPLDEPTAKFFAERFMDIITKLGRRHPEWTMEQLQAGAETRVQKQFIERPAVAGAIQEAEEDEMDESLREQIISLSQIASI